LSECSSHTDGAEETDGERIGDRDYPINFAHKASEEHPQQCEKSRNAEIPVCAERNQGALQQKVSQKSAAQTSGSANHCYAEEIELAVSKLGCEHGALQTPDANRRKVNPRGNFY
jgi:hypothetical protein